MTTRADTATAMLLRQSRLLLETLRRQRAAYDAAVAQMAALTAERRALLQRVACERAERPRRRPCRA